MDSRIWFDRTQVRDEFCIEHICAGEGEAMRKRALLDISAKLYALEFLDTHCSSAILERVVLT